MGKPARNDITHDKIKTKPQNEKYATGWERIFGNKETDTEAEDAEVFETTEDLYKSWDNE